LASLRKRFEKSEDLKYNDLESGKLKNQGSNTSKNALGKNTIKIF